MNKFSNLKICFTSTDLNAYSETFIRNLKDGLDAEIFHCYGAMFPYLSEDKNLQNYKTPPLLDLIQQRIGLIKKPLRGYYLIKYLKAQRINLIFANYGPSGAVLAPIAEELSIPLIVHFHGYDASIFEVVSIYRSHYQQMFAIAKAIVVVSEEMKRDLIVLGAPEEKLFKITYSPNKIFFDVKPNYQSNQVLAVGRFVEKKAPHLTLLAFQKAKETCPELQLKFVGSGELLAICQDLCLFLNIKNVHFIGVLSPEEIAKEMSNSFCFIQHSKQATNGDKEGTPVAILEAVAAGLPVISTRHAGIPEVVSEGINGYLVEEGDVEGMAKYLVDLAQNRNIAIEVGKAGKREIKVRLGVDKYFYQWNELLSKICLE